MQKLRLLVVVCLLFAIAAGTALAQPLTAEEGEVIADGFNGPQGVFVEPDGYVLVIEAGMGGEDEILFYAPGATEAAPSPWGYTARIIAITPDGEQIVAPAALPSIVAGTDVIGGARVIVHDGRVFATSGQWIEFNGPDRRPLMGAVVDVSDMTIIEVADLWAVEEAENPDGLLVDSHPYGLAAGHDGWLWVTDAGANTLLRVNPDDGAVEVVAAFDGLPGAFPNPTREMAIETDPVPTGIAFDADGNAYVSLLSGVPFIPGNARVMMVDADGEVSEYATGLTMLTDLQTAPDGTMYAVQFAMFSLEGPVPNSGAIIRIGEGDTSEVVVTGLSFPTGLAIDADGNAYVAINGVGAPESGAVVKFEAIESVEGTPITEMGADE